MSILKLETQFSKLGVKKTACTGNIYDLTSKSNSKIKLLKTIFLLTDGRNENETTGRKQV